MAGRNEDLTVQDALDTFPLEGSPEQRHGTVSGAIPARVTRSLLQFPRERVLVRPPAANPIAVPLTIMTAVLIVAIASVAPRPTRSPLRSTMTASWVPLAVPAVVAIERPGLALARDRDVQRVLNRYRDGFSILDVAAVKTVWPSADEDALRQGFASVYDQNVEFDSCRIAAGVAAATAHASCRGQVSYARNKNLKQRRRQVKEWQFTLVNDGKRWLILSVNEVPQGPG